MALKEEAMEKNNEILNAITLLEFAGKVVLYLDSNSDFKNLSYLEKQQVLKTAADVYNQAMTLDTMRISYAKFAKDHFK